MQKANFLSQIVFEILKFKKIIQYDWSRTFSITTQELDFSQLCGFRRFLKATMMYHLKSRNHTDGPFFFSKSVFPIYFRALSAFLTKT